MNIYIQNFIHYFDNVLHSSGTTSINGKNKAAKNIHSLSASPESYNIRGGIAKKQEKLRRNPAP